MATGAIHCSVSFNKWMAWWMNTLRFDKKMDFKFQLGRCYRCRKIEVSGSSLDIFLVSREVFRESTPWCLIKNLVKKIKRHPKHGILGFKSVSHEGRTPPNRLQKGTLFGSKRQRPQSQKHCFFLEVISYRTSMGHTFFGASKECALSLASSSSL